MTESQGRKAEKKPAKNLERESISKDVDLSANSVGDTISVAAVAFDTTYRPQSRKLRGDMLKKENNLIQVFSCNLTPSDFDTIAESFARQQPTKLVLRSCTGITEEGIKRLTSVMNRSNTLEVSGFGSDITDGALKGLKDRVLDKLVVEPGEGLISADGVKNICRMRRLSSLYLSCPPSNKSSGFYVALANLVTRFQLGSLELRKPIVELFQKCRIYSLFLREANLSPSKIEHLNNSEIQDLHFFSCDIDGPTIKSMQNLKCKRLFLRNCSGKGLSVNSLKDLAKNTALEELILTSHRLSEQESTSLNDVFIKAKKSFKYRPLIP